MHDFTSILKRIDSYREDMLRMQIELTAIPSIAPESGGEGEYERAVFLGERLSEFGFSDVQWVNAPDKRVPSGIRPNIVARVQGENQQCTVWIFTHTDTVPPGETTFWERSPFAGYEKDGRVYGLGTEDNQQDLVASVFAAKAFIDEGVKPGRSIALGLLADEEVGSVFGMEHLVNSRQDLFRRTDLYLAPDYGNVNGSVIEIAEKSVLWIRFRVSGRQCHASKPHLGNNSLRAASHLIVTLEKLYEKFDRTDPIFLPNISTFEPTRKDANVQNVNTIPGEDVFYFDCRVLPSYSLGEITAEISQLADEIRQKFGVEIEITPIQSSRAPEPTPADAPVVTELRSAIREIYSVDASVIGIGGNTVAVQLRRKGFPIAVWSRLGNKAHSPNEFCIISNMVGNAKVYARLFF